MFTSRAEYRILLRQDNADERLTPLSHRIGFASDYRMRLLDVKQTSVSALVKACSQTRPSVADVNPILEAHATSLLTTPKSISSLVARPQISLSDVIEFVPRGTIEEIIQASQLPLSSPDFLPSSTLPEAFKSVCQDCPSIFSNIVSSSEIAIKYSGYIEREAELAKKLKKLEGLRIPHDFDYSRIESLSIESRMKLTKHSPSTIAEASRIPGVSPSDISVLLVYFGR